MRNGPIPPGDFTAAMIELALRIHREGIDKDEPTRVIVTRIARAVMSGCVQLGACEQINLNCTVKDHDEDAYRIGVEAVDTLRSLPF